MKELAGLVGDIAIAYGTHFKQDFIDNDRLNYLVNNLNEQKDQECNALAQFVISEVKKVIS